jgi:hypothetical protein
MPQIPIIGTAIGHPVREEEPDSGVLTRGESETLFMLNPVIFAGYGLKSSHNIEQF